MQYRVLHVPAIIFLGKETKRYEKFRNTEFSKKKIIFLLKRRKFSPLKCDLTQAGMLPPSKRAPSKKDYNKKKNRERIVLLL